MNILELKNLSKTYGKGETAVQALKGIDLQVSQREFVAIVGPSGSGKSTLLHLAGGLDNPTDGKVILDGEDIFLLNEAALAVLRRRKIGFIFQFYNLIPVLSAEENILLPILLDNKKTDREYIDELTEFLGLKDRLNHLPNALSGGQQQRVAIARALANKPSIIFADEPTGNLDTEMGREVLDLLRLSIKRYHQTLVVITHDLNIAKTADRLITLRDGSIESNEVVRK